MGGHGVARRSIRAFLTPSSRDADRYDVPASPEATAVPLAFKHFSCDARCARPMGNVTLVKTLVPVRFIPPVLPVPLTSPDDERSFEAVDEPAVLEPLHHTLTHFHPGS